jgi:toxin-antitoxin system PIN domain toxin
MKIVDTNVLLYAIDRDAPQHQRLRAWLEAALNGDEPVGFAWIVVLGFVRLATRPRVFLEPLSMDVAISVVDGWLAQPNARLLAESEEHWRHLRGLLQETRPTGKLTTDAHLAAIAVAYGASIVSCDGDFARFRQIRWENPLATP